MRVQVLGASLPLKQNCSTDRHQRQSPAMTEYERVPSNGHVVGKQHACALDDLC